jgi:hypothetical protein
MRQTAMALLGATLTVGAAVGLVWLTQNPPPAPETARGPETASSKRTHRTEVPGHALEPGRDSEIVLLQDGDLIRFSVDGKELWVASGRLHGTVTVYPAWDSTIGVKDVQIRGRAVPGVEVKGPPYPLQ